MIRASVEREVRLIDDLLDLTKISQYSRSPHTTHTPHVANSTLCSLSLDTS
jgi:hypothetical protein